MLKYKEYTALTRKKKNPPLSICLKNKKSIDNISKGITQGSDLAELGHKEQPAMLHSSVWKQ